MADDNAPADDILSVIDGAPNSDAGITGDEGEEYVEGSPPSQSDTPADDAETTDADVDEEEAEKPAPEPKKGGVEKRIGELTKARHEADRRATAAEAKAQAYEELLRQFPNLAQPGKAPDAPAVVDDPEPTEENFKGTFEQLEEARLAWRVRQEVTKITSAQQAKQQLQAEQQRTQDRAAEAEKRVADFVDRGEKSFPGFKESVAHLADTLDRSPSISSTVLELPEGPDVLLYMARKPEEAERIAALSPVRQAVEIGALAERIRVARAAKKNTNASPPINPLGGSSAPAPKDPEKMTMAEYKAWRAAKK